MLKFFRKYNKFILVVGGSLLMVVFLLQGALSRLGADPMTRTYAHLDGHKLTNKDQYLAARDLQSLDQLIPALTQVLFGIESGDTDHWILLVDEAEKAGLIGADADGPEWIPELAIMAVQVQYQRQYPQYWQMIWNMQGAQETQRATESLNNAIPLIAARNNMTAIEFGQALSKARGVWRLFDTYSQAARFSDRRAKHVTKEALDGIAVNYVFIPSDHLINEVPEPDDATLAAHLQEFKDVRPGAGDFGIGYTLPPRIKLEWLKIDRLAIEASVKLDAVEVNKAWRQDRTTYPGEFDVERARVESTIRNGVVDQIMQAADKTVRAEILRETRRLEEKGAYRVLPDDWAQTRPTFETVAQTVVEHVGRQTGHTIALPEVSVRSANWHQPNEVSSLEGLGGAQLRAGNVSIPVTNLLFNVQELDGSEQFPIQIGLPSVEYAIVDSIGSRYYVTVLDARDESPAESVDEAGRDTVLKNYQQLAAYKLLQDRSDQLASTASGEDKLDALVTLFSPPKEETDKETPDGETPNEAAQNNDTPTPAPSLRTQVIVRHASMQPSDPQVDLELFRDAVWQAAANLNPLATPESVAGSVKPFAVSLPSRLGIAIAQLVAPRPLTAEDFAMSVEGQIVQSAFAELRDAPGSRTVGAFGRTRLLERHDFIIDGVRVLDESPDTDQAVDADESEGDTTSG